MEMEAGFGSHHIGFVGSVGLLLNNILGPGIANFTGLYQQAGWVCPTAMVLLCMGMSLACGEMLLASMQAIPGNQNFEKRVEFGTLCRHYLPRVASVSFQCVFQLSMLTVNISNIVQTAQVCDYIIDQLWGDSCAMMFYPTPFRCFCHTDPSDISPFGTGKILLSVGLLAVAILSVPLGYFNLDDNVCVQKVALVMIGGSILAWVVVFMFLGLDPDRVPAVGSSFHNMGGTILFNFMFIATLPSWASEKSPSVSAVRAVALTLVLALVSYTLVGVIGGMAFAPFFKTDNTLLSQLDHIKSSRAVQLTAYLAADIYAIAANMASIPIFSIIMRYNLVESGLLHRYAATAVSVILPWVVSVLLYTGDGFKSVVNFAGTFTSSIVNLMVPCLLFISALRRSDSRTCRSTEESPGGLLSVPSGTPPHIASARAALESCARPRLIWKVLAWGNLSCAIALTLLAVIDSGVPA